MRTHLVYLKLLSRHAMRHADASGAAMTVVTVILLVIGVGGLFNGVMDLVPGGGVYTLAGFGGLYMAGKSAWDADQKTITTLGGSGNSTPEEASLALAAQAITLNGHQTDYAAVLRACWQKLAQGATEPKIEWELHRYEAFLPPTEQEQQYLVAVPDLDFFFGHLRLLEAVEIVTLRVPANPIRLFFTSTSGPPAAQEVIGPTDEQRYLLTQFGRRIVALLVSQPVPNR